MGIFGAKIRESVCVRVYWEWSGVEFCLLAHWAQVLSFCFGQFFLAPFFTVTSFLPVKFGSILLCVCCVIGFGGVVRVKIKKKCWLYDPSWVLSSRPLP